MGSDWNFVLPVVGRWHFYFPRTRERRDFEWRGDCKICLSSLLFGSLLTTDCRRITRKSGGLLGDRSLWLWWLHSSFIASSPPPPLIRNDTSDYVLLLFFACMFTIQCALAGTAVVFRYRQLAGGLNGVPLLIKKNKTKNVSPRALCKHLIWWEWDTSKGFIIVVAVRLRMPPVGGFKHN